MQFFTKEQQPTQPRKRFGRALAAALLFQAAPGYTGLASAQQAHQERVTANQVYRQTPLNPVRLARLGENPVVRNGGVLSLNEIHATRESFAPQMQDWAENDFENTLRLMSGYRAGATATSDAALVQRIETTLASAPRIAGMNQEVDVTSLLQANGYQVGNGVQVTLEAVSGGESQTYVAGTQADGPDGAKLIPLGAHDGIVVEGDGNGANESIRIRISRVVNRNGQHVIETVSVDAADFCGNAFLLPYMEQTAPAAPEAVNPCPPRSRITVENLPANSEVTVVYNVDMGRHDIPTVDGAQCPAASLPEICPDCTRTVATRLTQEVADVKHLHLGILSAQTLQVSGRTLDVEIPGTMPVNVGGRIVNIDLQRAIRDGSIIVSLSCPRNRGAGGSGLSSRIQGSEDHNVTIDLPDWAWAQNNRDGDGEVNLPLRYNGDEYVRGRLHSSN